MNKDLFPSDREINPRAPGPFINVKSYVDGLQLSTNPYASIDDFLDDTWNVSGPSEESNSSILNV